VVIDETQLRTTVLFLAKTTSPDELAVVTFGNGVVLVLLMIQFTSYKSKAPHDLQSVYWSAVLATKVMRL
jgi:hypothetical protein